MIPDNTPPKTTPSDAEIRARQQSRAKVLGLLLGAFAILMFFVTLVKIGGPS